MELDSAPIDAQLARLERTATELKTMQKISSRPLQHGLTPGAPILDVASQWVVANAHADLLAALHASRQLLARHRPLGS